MWQKNSVYIQTLSQCCFIKNKQFIFAFSILILRQMGGDFETRGLLITTVITTLDCKSRPNMPTLKELLPLHTAFLKKTTLSLVFSLLQFPPQGLDPDLMPLSKVT